MPLPPPPPPPAAPTGSTPAPTRHPRDVALGVAIALLLVVGSVAAVVKVNDPARGHPKEWDPRVADLAAFVERARGLDFDHPVPVDFLSAAEYTKATTGDGAELGKEETAELDQQGAQLRAFGVASGKIDLAAAFNQVNDAGTLAFYDPSDQRVRVRGTEVSVGLKVTLVHELTHALQDQHFDLDHLLGSSKDNGAATARRALAEGDAIRIEEDYVNDELSTKEQDEYDDEYQGSVDESVAGTADVPDFVSASFGIPYALGPPFVTMLVDDGGNAGVDQAFDDPPSTEEHLFDPASYLAKEGGKAPDLGLDDDDDSVQVEGPLGSPSWFLILAQRMDPAQAFEAALGWNGDDYASYERGGTTCVRAVFRGDTEDDEREMSAALDAWAAGLPGGKAKRVDVKGHPGLDSCDPGEDVQIPLAKSSTDLLLLPNTWGYLEAETARALGPEGSRCFAQKILEGIGFDRLVDPAQQDALIEEVQAKASAASSACGSADR